MTRKVELMSFGQFCCTPCISLLFPSSVKFADEGT